MIDFKGLIDVLRRKAREEDYAGPSVTRIMTDMPREEMLLALTEIVKAVSAVNRDSKVSLRERYRLIVAFEEKARPLVALLVRVYQGQDKIDGLHPRHVLPSLIAYWHELAAAYKVCLKQHAQSHAARFADQAELITLRAIGYYAQQAKWSYLRYFEPEARVWRNLNRLYQIADATGFAQKPIARYPDEAPSTVAEHYLHAALLKLAEPERRRPEQIWQIDDWLTARLATVRIEKIIRPREQTFGIHLDEAKPPMKLRRNMIGDAYRYLATEPLANSFAREAEALRHTPPLAADAPSVDPGTLNLLADLAVVYSHAGQQRSRRSERQTVGRDVRAAVGLKAAFGVITGDEPDSETWSLVDESTSGMGAHYKARFDDRVQVGELVLLQEQTAQYSLHVVRRVTKSREGLAKVGVERLANQPVAVTLTHAGQTIRALFCNETGYGSRGLILHRVDWADADDITLATGSKRYGIQLGPELEHLPNHLMVAFTVRERR